MCNNDLTKNVGKYYVCDTIASEQTKVITVPDNIASITTGMRITVYFNNSNTYTSNACYLKLQNSAGTQIGSSYYIYCNVNGSNYRYSLLRGAVPLTFNGSYWIVDSDAGKITYNGYPYYRLNFALSGDTLTITPYTSM